MIAKQRVNRFFIFFILDFPIFFLGIDYLVNFLVYNILYLYMLSKPEVQAS